MCVIYTGPTTRYLFAYICIYLFIYIDIKYIYILPTHVYMYIKFATTKIEKKQEENHQQKQNWNDRDDEIIGKDLSIVTMLTDLKGKHEHNEKSKIHLKSHSTFRGENTISKIKTTFSA